MAGAAFPPCAHCGAPEARTSLSGTDLCDRCVNDRISRKTGRPQLPDLPPIETVRAADGRDVRFRTRLWWAPSGVLVAEAEEVDRPPGDGFEFSVAGALDADPHEVLAHLRSIVHREVGSDAGGQRRKVPDLPSIDQVLVAFLDDQRARLAASTYRRYQEIVGLLHACLNEYGFGTRPGAQPVAGRAAVEACGAEVFTRRAGPDRILEHYDLFLGHFMIRQVVDASEQHLKAAGTVTKRLASWLADHGYVDDDAAKQARDEATEYDRQLATVRGLRAQLSHQAEQTRVLVDISAIPEEDWVDDHLPITRIEQGRLWFDDLGPVRVPSAATDAAEVGWYVTVTLIRREGSWHLIEVGPIDR